MYKENNLTAGTSQTSPQKSSVSAEVKRSMDAFTTIEDLEVIYEISSNNSRHLARLADEFNIPVSNSGELVEEPGNLSFISRICYLQNLIVKQLRHQSEIIDELSSFFKH